jgi:hypothetical protein
MIRKKRFSMMEPLARSRTFERVISELDEIIEDTADYFDDELTAQLNITKAWLNDALLTVRQHELQRIKLANEIYTLSRIVA